MDITIEQAKAFASVAQHGTIQKAAKSLNKGHSAILYLIKGLEEQTQLTLFDRSGYRNRLTLEGEIVLKYCRQLIETRKELERVCTKLRSDWEPRIKLVYDGVVDFDLIAGALSKLNESQVPTEIKVVSAYLNEVEVRFEEEEADLMVTVLPIQQSDISFVKLQPIRMLLVASHRHPLNQGKSKVLETSALQGQTYIKIRGAANELGLSTEPIDAHSSFSVNDFYTKKQAILKGLGYGWLPEYMIDTEVKSNKLKMLRTQIDNVYILKPRLYYRNEDFIGRTTKQLLAYFKENSK